MAVTQSNKKCYPQGLLESVLLSKLNILYNYIFKTHVYKIYLKLFL